MSIYSTSTRITIATVTTTTPTIRSLTASTATRMPTSRYATRTPTYRTRIMGTAILSNAPVLDEVFRKSRLCACRIAPIRIQD
jgi:hypothetical protein